MVTRSCEVPKVSNNSIEIGNRITTHKYERDRVYVKSWTTEVRLNQSLKYSRIDREKTFEIIFSVFAYLQNIKIVW